MRRDLSCLAKRLACYLNQAGALAEIVMRRIDETNSGDVHPIYDERPRTEKVFHTWNLWAVVDENPKRNVKGALGAEVERDLEVVLYGRGAHGGTRMGETYEPEHRDFIDYRGETFEVTRIERVLPTGTDSQFAYMLMGKRYR